MSKDNIKYVDMGFDEIPMIVAAETRFDALVENVCGNGLWGLERLSMLPGTVAEAVTRNASAYDSDLASLVAGVVCFDNEEQKKVKFAHEACDFGPGTSLFLHQKERYTISSVLIRVKRGDCPAILSKELRGLLGLEDGQKYNGTPQDVRDAIISYRSKLS